VFSLFDTENTVAAAPVDAGTMARVAILTAANNYQLAVNGATPVVDTSVSPPAVNQLRIGATVAGASVANTTIGRLCYFGPGAAASFIQRMTA
jgi:hypothetical protein